LNEIRSLSKWRLAFWVGITVFWVLFLAAAPTPTEFALRAAMLVVAGGLYFWILRNEPVGEPGPMPERVIWMVGALAVLAAFGVYYYEGALQKTTSGVLALSVTFILIENLAGRDRA
jgi:hypothetical protein